MSARDWVLTGLGATSCALFLLTAACGWNWPVILGAVLMIFYQVLFVLTVRNK